MGDLRSGGCGSKQLEAQVIIEEILGMAKDRSQALANVVRAS
ncbi:MAG TPA: hypothetical protein VNA57_11000 [Acidimicrobiales bacterium]|nr:hypothetical protein [Acidimicrobiales bacterium]